MWQAAYELYAHTAVARKAGLAEDVIQAVVSGQLPAGLSEEEALAHECTRQIVTAHRIDTALYERAVGTFGEKSVFDLLVLAGQYMSISAILNTFAVPAPDARPANHPV